ncbi:MAG: hypothetical protein ABMA13_21150 [Chthoniobacteraceae bacterium]
MNTRIRIEILESRIAPATLDVVGGLLTYTAGVGIGNSVTLAIAGANYSINDSQEPISLGSGAVTAGFTGSGSNTVLGSNTAVSSLSFLLGDQNDQFAVSGLTDPLTMDGQAGTVDTAFVTGAIAPGGVLSFAAETITINAAISGATSASFTADTMAINAAVAASADVLLRPLTAGRSIDLGTETGGKLSLTDAELDRFTTPTLLVVADPTGAIAVSAALSLTNTGTFLLQSGGALSATGAGAISVANLGIATAAAVTLNGANDIDTLAANVTNTGAAFAFTDADGFQIGTVDGLTGLATNTAAGGNITLSGGRVEQAAGAAITGSGLALLGAGSFVLLDAANDITTLAANTTGVVHFTDATGIDVGTVGTTSGLTANNGVMLTALGGDIHVLNANGTAAPDISGFNVSLTAGAAGSDFEIILDANAGIVSTGFDTLTADHMTLGAGINAGTSQVSLRTFETTTAINLGGADAAGTLGLTDAELDFITAGQITIGANTNPQTVSAAIAPANSALLSLSGAGVNGAGSIAVAALEISLGGGNVALNGANDVDFLSLSDIGTGSPTLAFTDADGFALGSPFDNQTALPDFTVATLTAGGAGVSVDPGSTLLLGVGGATPGVGHDQIVVNGTLTLTGADLSVQQSSGGILPFSTEFVLLKADTLIGTFAGLPEGASLPSFVTPATITYMGGDGNDVAIRTVTALDVQLSNGGKTATYRDVDGDLVTVKSSIAFTGSEFFGIETGANGAGQLQKLTLGAGFTGANITITAKPSADGGNGFVNLGLLDATGVDLGAFSLAGDLGQLKAGTIAGDTKVPGLKSLTVQSVGLLGTSTQPAGGATTGVRVEGALPKVAIKGDARALLQTSGAADGKFGSVTIGGSLVRPAAIFADAGIGSLKIGGDIHAGTGSLTIQTSGPIGPISVGGSIVGTSAGATVSIFAEGQLTAPTKGADVALKSLTVGGSVEFLRLELGNGNNANADVSLGSIAVGGDWIASLVRAGTKAGTDGVTGTADDAKVSSGTVRDNPAIFSSIGSFTVKGQALGTATPTSDMFGIVAERIGKAKVGGRTFAFKADTATVQNREAFFAAPTLDGAGAENPMFDFTIRELGSLTPTVALGGANLVIAANGKTATFTDVDGDLVTVKRTLGAFVAGDFTITTAASGGGQLDLLAFTAAPGNLSITAKPGPDGGNGLVNVTGIGAPGLDLGAVSIAGDLQNLTAGSGGGAPAAKSLAARSLGLLAIGGSLDLTGALPKLTVATDVRANVNVGDILGSAKLGGSLAAGGKLFASDGIGKVKIAGDVRGGATIETNDRIGSITIGGELLGASNGTATIEALARDRSATTKGADLALKSLTVKGGVEGALVRLGFGFNADASLGALSVGREWLSSSVQAGVEKGADTFIGTADDSKTTATTLGFTDVATRFSTIAKITIKGQALGSAAVGDSFGIVAEQIGKAKIGARTFVFDKGERDAADSFAAAPTGPGPAPDNAASDFFIREIVT